MNLKEMMIHKFVTDLEEENNLKLKKLVVVFDVKKHKLERLIGIDIIGKKIELKS